MENQENMPNLTNKETKRKKALGWFLALLIIFSIFSVVYWFLFLKGYESTDDAYVSGNQVQLSSQLNGNVKQINVDNMDFVRAGDVLVELDDADMQLAFEQAKQSLALAVRKINQIYHTIGQLQATVKAQEVMLERDQGDLNRREALIKTGGVDIETLQHSREDVAATKATLESYKQQLAANKALLLDTPLREQPEVKNAVSNVRQTWLNLQRTKILSPVTGYIAKRNVQVGARVSVGSALMAIIPINETWIDANFKETQLKNIRIGQPVTFTVDLYGKDIEFKGKIFGIGLGTGSAFSLLPAQNATGNWIKVVQRVPVRVSINLEQLAKYPLRIGLSADVEVNTKDSNGEVLLPEKELAPVYQTNALHYDESEVNKLIDQIVQENNINE